jgi:hypothetical protein
VSRCNRHVCRALEIHLPFDFSYLSTHYIRFRLSCLWVKKRRKKEEVDWIFSGVSRYFSPFHPARRDQTARFIRILRVSPFQLSRRFTWGDLCVACPIDLSRRTRGRQLVRDQAFAFERSRRTGPRPDILGMDAHLATSITPRLHWPSALLDVSSDPLWHGGYGAW